MPILLGSIKDHCAQMSCLSSRKNKILWIGQYSKEQQGNKNNRCLYMLWPKQKHKIFQASPKNWRIQTNSAVSRWHSCSYISATFTWIIFLSLTLYRYLSNFYTDHDFLWGKKCGEGDKSCHRKQGQERTRALEISNKYKKES